MTGPCTPWIDGDDVAACCSVETSSGAIFDTVAQSASDLLFALSGRLYAGTCERTVRPCRTTCACGWQILSRGFVVPPQYWWWNNWTWWNGLESCGCTSLSRVKLAGYPVQTVDEVKIDGVIVDPTTYRLDENRYLTRVRDPLEPDVVLSWPGCQNLDLDDTQQGTFSVSYTYGAEPPQLGMDAAAQLACELYKACDEALSGDCLLPSGVTRIQRQGITIERLAFTSWAFQNQKWQTGLSLVDAFLNTVNPAGLIRRPTFWAPSITHRYARPVG